MMTLCRKSQWYADLCVAWGHARCAILFVYLTRTPHVRLILEGEGRPDERIGLQFHESCVILETNVPAIEPGESHTENPGLGA